MGITKALLKQFNQDHDQEQDDLIVLVRGSGVVLVGMASKVIFTFLTELIAARILLPERYGLISWGILFINTFSMVSGLGLNTAIQRFLPMYRAKSDKGSARGIIELTSVLSLLGGLAGTLIVLFGADWLAGSVFGDAREKPILLILVFVLPLWNLHRVMVALFAAFKIPFFKVLIDDFLIPVGLFLVVLTAGIMGSNEQFIAGGYVLVYLCSNALSLLLARLKTPYKDIVLVKPSYHAREVLKFSWPLMFTGPIGKFTGAFDILIVGIFVKTFETGLYRVASDVAAITSLVLMIFGFMYLPIAAKFFAVGDYPRWDDMNSRVSRWSMLMTFPFFAVLFFLPHELISTVYGQEYAGAAPILRILSVSYFFNAMVGYTGSNLVIAGMTKIQLLGHLIGLMITIVGSILLIPVYGITGAALASLLSLATVNILFLIVMKLRLGLNPFTGLYLKNLAVLVLGSLGGSFILHQIHSIPAILSIAIMALICLGLMGLLYFYGQLIDSREKIIVRSVLKKISFRWSPPQPNK